DATQDANFTYIQTTLPGTLPTWGTGIVPDRIQQHIAYNATFRNCTGCNTVLSLSQAPAARPLFEYAKHVHVGFIGSGLENGGPSNQEYLWTFVWGTLVSVTVNVMRPYTGVNSNCQVTHRAATTVKPDYTKLDWQFTIDLKTAGIRTL